MHIHADRISPKTQPCDAVIQAFENNVLLEDLIQHSKKIYFTRLLLTQNYPCQSSSSHVNEQKQMQTIKWSKRQELTGSGILYPKPDSSTLNLPRHQMLVSKEIV
jgi:hypothetical protein